MQSRIISIYPGEQGQNLYQLKTHNQEIEKSFIGDIERYQAKAFLKVYGVARVQREGNVRHFILNQNIQHGKIN